MFYNVYMDRNIYTTAIVGGGAAGLFLATQLQGKTVLFERGERLGRKLSATGNGQGNVTNLSASKKDYFSFSDDGKIETVLQTFPAQSCTETLERLGLLLIADERGRVYPAGRQASALTDALRFQVANQGVETRLHTRVTGFEKVDGVFRIQTDDGECFARNLVLCTGGKAAKNFGTDGTAYALATVHGHTLTGLYPSLVQLKTETKHTKTLKGIRVADAGVQAAWREKGKTYTQSLLGDVIFTDYGVSGDAVFRLSAFLVDKENAELSVDFLPNYTQERIFAALQAKKENFPNIAVGELLCGMVNNQIARTVMKRADGDLFTAAKLVKTFTLPITGSLGFDYAQVTKGGVRMDEVDENLQSRFVRGLYFAGEILDVDGQCGGFNLQWAYASASTVARALNGEGRGHVCV